MLPHQIMQGTTWHHSFQYPYRLWAINLTQLERHTLPEVSYHKTIVGKSLGSLFGKLFGKLSAQPVVTVPLLHRYLFTIYRFCPQDYFRYDKLDNLRLLNGLTNAPLLTKVQQAFITLTGSQPTGDILALMVLRNMGWYFSPVNFYIGFDTAQQPSIF